jgi:hypothetical protein
MTGEKTRAGQQQKDFTAPFIRRCQAGGKTGSSRQNRAKAEGRGKRVMAGKIGRDYFVSVLRSLRTFL